jgi:hypothetical protein
LTKSVAGILNGCPQLFPLTVRVYVDGTIAVEVVRVMTVEPHVGPLALVRVAPDGTPDTEIGIPFTKAHPLYAKGVTV